MSSVDPTRTSAEIGTLEKFPFSSPERPPINLASARAISRCRVGSRNREDYRLTSPVAAKSTTWLCILQAHGTAVRANALLWQPGSWTNFPSLAERSDRERWLFR